MSSSPHSSTPYNRYSLTASDVQEAHFSLMYYSRFYARRWHLMILLFTNNDCSTDRGTGGVCAMYSEGSARKAVTPLTWIDTPRPR
jgi:hypothetical protein